MNLSDIGRVLVLLGVALAIVGGVLVLGGHLGLGHLPGDVAFGKGKVRVYVPVATSIILSVVLTLVLNAVLRR